MAQRALEIKLCRGSHDRPVRGLLCRCLPRLTRTWSEISGCHRRKSSSYITARDVNRFDPAREAPSGLRASLGFSPNDPSIGRLGKARLAKGSSRIAEGPSVGLFCRFPRVTRVVCVGDGSLRERMNAASCHPRIAGAGVRFVGFQPNVEELGWRWPPATVLPSFYEGLPLAAIETGSGKTDAGVGC